MNSRGPVGRHKTAAQRAEEAFKPELTVRHLTEEEEAQVSFHENRERLKTERLAREAEIESKANNDSE